MSNDPFEGPEKLLELWLSPLENIPNNGLRSIPRKDIDTLLSVINCKVLSRISSAKLDAYLLSESSLFVFNNKLILKTCGTTATLLCMNVLFELVKQYIGWDLTRDPPFKLFYSRRTFMFPDKQTEIHRNWDSEVLYLDKFFPQGYSYIVGKSNKDHWHLYTAGIGFMNHNNLSVNSFISSTIVKKGIVTEFKDQTFEVLMTKLGRVHVFNTESFIAEKSVEYDGHKVGDMVFEESGLSRIYNDLKHTSNCFSFIPCGFSSNSIIDDCYYTLHVTPESGWSYASFETNVVASENGTNSKEILQKLVDIFAPGCLCFTIFELKDEFDNHQSNLEMLSKLQISGYKRVEKISYDVDEYDLLYVNFEKVNLSS